MARRYAGVIVAVLVAFIAVSLRGISAIITDVLWFREVGYQQALWVPVASQLVLGVTIGVVFFAFIFSNLRMAASSLRVSAPLFHQLGISADVAARRVRQAFLIISMILAVLAGLGGSSRWMVVQQFLHPTYVGTSDPVFGLDIGFYLFVLPFHRFAYSVLMTLVVMTASLAAAIYVVTRSIGMRGIRITGSPAARRHVVVLIALAFVMKAWGYRLAALGLVYSTRGAAFGAGYTDVHTIMPALGVLAVVAVVAGVLVLASLFAPSERLALGAAGMLVIGSFLLGTVYPALVQKLSVEPNELSREQPYIQHNIEATRAAFGLSEIDVRPFSVRNDLSLDRLMTAYRDTVESIRLWDWRPLAQTYEQLQEFRVYYEFADADVDRYHAGGRARQAALSARELALAELPDQARTWVNEHLVYTHGYGLAMSDVNKASAEGLPIFLIRDIPLKSDQGFEVTRPQIYYGERTDAYAVVGTSARELDYPTGEANVYTNYGGRGGVPLSSFLAKAAFAARFGSLKLLMSTDISRGSRILFRRNIRDRVTTIAPFLVYDRDPYLVLADGRLYWLWDAYTVSSMYPYSQPTEDGINYIRNSVKVVVDAYDGDVEFYAPDPDEPILKCLSGVFPGMFKPLDLMPESIKAHIRYPEDLFTIQARVLNAYHTTNAEAFYKREDFWDFPMEVSGGERLSVQPYYVLMSTGPGAPPEYLLILPFTPAGKDNMIAWLAARSDAPHYGQLMLYLFPKDQMVYGPMQVESRIDQDPAISQALTLWSQRGSRVVRGNLLVIPVEDSVIYVEPLYLLAERSELPELKRVIVAFGNAVAMDTTLEGALASAFGKGTRGQGQPEPAGIGGAAPGLAPAPTPAQTPAPSEGAPDTTGATVPELAARALQAYNEANARLREGDFAGFGRSLEEVGRLLRELEERAK